MNRSIRLRSLGQTSVSLSPIGLGTWQFSAGKGSLGKHWDPLPEQTMNGIVRAALEDGVNWFDTAESYGDGASERNLTNALQASLVSPGDVVIADKWWPKERTAKSIVDSISERLRCLQGYPIDLYQIHWPESKSWLRTEMKALARLVEEGKVRSVGLCNYNFKLIRRAHKYLAKQGIPLASIQVRYSLLDRTIEKNNILKTAQDLGMSVIAWSPLEQGLLTGRFHADPASMQALRASRKNMFGLTTDRLKQTQPLIDLLTRIADRHSATVAQVALHWLTHVHGDLVFAIPGASNEQQAHSNSQSMNLTLSADELAEIAAWGQV